MQNPLFDLGDCEWFAYDSIGQIALFTSAGSRYVPEYYLANLDLLIEFSNIVKHLPIICSHKLNVRKEPGLRYDSWIDASNKGIYGYDFNLYTNSGFELISSPDVPIRCNQIDAASAKRIPFYSGVFGDSSKIIGLSVTEWVPKGK